MQKQEDKLRVKTLKHLADSSLVGIRHEDLIRTGVPDFSLTAYGRTTWWEFKHGTPKFSFHGLQHFTMTRLSKHGSGAFYVLYREDKDGENKESLIVRPENIYIPTQTIFRFEFRFEGYAHDSLATSMRWVTAGRING